MVAPHLWGISEAVERFEKAETGVGAHSGLVTSWDLDVHGALQNGLDEGIREIDRLGDKTKDDRENQEDSNGAPRADRRIGLDFSCLHASFEISTTAVSGLVLFDATVGSSLATENPGSAQNVPFDF
mmetsp:Transcript_11277/g.32570  ORF Transcript_11277/g.32570 Transcript_11277/m.32570 type:complete len:127 (+) Transcript_11277:421-801(+)